MGVPEQLLNGFPDVATDFVNGVTLRVDTAPKRGCRIPAVHLVFRASKMTGQDAGSLVSKGWENGFSLVLSCTSGWSHPGSKSLSRAFLPDVGPLLRLYEKDVINSYL